MNKEQLIGSKALKEVMTFIVKKYVVFEGLVNPLVDHIMKTIEDHLDGHVYHFDYPNEIENKKFGKCVGGFPCDVKHKDLAQGFTGNANEEKALMYKGRLMVDIIENSYILADYRDVNHRYFILVDECNLNTIKVVTNEIGAFIKDEVGVCDNQLSVDATYKFMIMVAKYLESKNK